MDEIRKLELNVIIMGLKFNSEESGKWWELIIGWKWPHEGFTLGYDFVEPNYEPIQDEELYYAFLLYLGPLSIIFNWGNYNWNG